MAKKHKAATEVTLVREEKSPFATWIDNNWRMMAVVAVGITALLLGSQIMQQRAESAADELQDALSEARLSLDPEAMRESARTTLEGSGLEGYATFSAAQIAVMGGDYEAAKADLAALEGNAPALLTNLPLPVGPEGESRSLLEHARATAESQSSQEEAFAVRFTNPEPAPGSPEVTLETSLGDVTVALYAQEAPLHVANFLKLVKAGTYDGVNFHRIMQGFMVQTGDPNTADPTKDETTWGTGGPEYTVPSEAENGLVHEIFSLGAAKGQGPDSSGSQFYITVGTPHDLDGVHTVFGRVVGGKDVVREIAAVPVVYVGRERSRPESPPVITRATVGVDLPPPPPVEEPSEDSSPADGAADEAPAEGPADGEPGDEDPEDGGE